MTPQTTRLADTVHGQVIAYVGTCTEPMPLADVLEDVDRIVRQHPSVGTVETTPNGTHGACTMEVYDLDDHKIAHITIARDGTIEALPVIDRKPRTPLSGVTSVTIGTEPRTWGPAVERAAKEIAAKTWGSAAWYRGAASAALAAALGLDPETMHRALTTYHHHLDEHHGDDERATAKHFYPDGTDIRCSSCRKWADAGEYRLVGEEGIECPSCSAVDMGDTIPEHRIREVPKR